MVATIDGATDIDGRSGRLGGPDDRSMFRAIRACADAILVGAGTARAEDYGEPRLPPALETRRVERGSTPRPTLAVVTSTCDLDPSSRLFRDGHRPIIFTGDGSRSERRAALQAVADVVQLPGDDVDLRQALTELRSRGNQTVLCEGGPSLNGALVDADLIDEFFVTVGPYLAGGQSGRMVAGATGELRRRTLDEILLGPDGALFCRWTRASS